MWAIDMGDKYPGATITGVDLSPTQAEWVPQNVWFEVDDIEEPWIYSKPFDFIHGRWLAASIRDWPKLIRQCRQNLHPGGWVEFADWDYTPRSTDLPDNYIRKWHSTLATGCEEKTGASTSPGPLLRDFLLNAGFDDVHEQVFKVPIGSWPRDKRLKEIGRYYRVAMEDGLEGISMRILTQLLGWDPLEANALNAHFRAEMKTENFYHSL